MDPQPDEGPSTPPHTPGYDPPDQSVRFVVMYNGNKDEDQDAEPWERLRDRDFHPGQGTTKQFLNNRIMFSVPVSS